MVLAKAASSASNAASSRGTETWPLYTPAAPTFRDVPVENAFYQHIETAYSHGLISGYNCGAGCLEFKPGNNATRGQICKIVYLAVTAP